MSSFQNVKLISTIFQQFCNNNYNSSSSNNSTTTFIYEPNQKEEINQNSTIVIKSKDKLNTKNQQQQPASDLASLSSSSTRTLEGSQKSFNLKAKTTSGGGGGGDGGRNNNKRNASTTENKGENVFLIFYKMANTLSVLIRNVVSKKRRRYTEGGFNLDLAYICDNIIAMGYPGEYIQSVFRNPMNDVCHFFEVTHPEHYKVYNLRSEKAYDVNKFHGRVSVYAFEDHNPPTIELIDKFCNDVDRWLNADPNNVAAIHCKAGKGRTGTMICCYLLYSGIKTTAEDALAYYGEKRTMNKKGVTIPSQRRYVHYYARLIRSKLKYERRTLQLCDIRFTPATVLQGTVQCSISTMEEIDCTETRTSNISAGTWTKVTVKELDRFPIDFRKTFTLELDEHKVFVTGDVKVELKKIFHFWFNSYFVCDTADYEGEGEDLKLIYTLPKWEIDDAHKDKEHKLFSEDFKVQLVLKPVSPHFQNYDDRSDIALLRQHKIHNNHVNSLTTHNANKLNFGSSAIPATTSSSKSVDPTFDAFHNLIQHPTIERSRKPTSMPPFVPSHHGGNNSGAALAMAASAGSGSSNNMHSNHNMQLRNHQQQKRSSEPTPSVNTESINRSNNKNQNNSSSYLLQQQQQQQQHLLHQQHTHLHHYQHHLQHEQQQQQQQQKLVQTQNQVSQQQQNCITSSNAHNTSSNSNSSSSSSISSQSTSSSSSSAGVGGGGSGGGGGGNEEDWESETHQNDFFINNTPPPLEITSTTITTTPASGKPSTLITTLNSSSPSSISSSSSPSSAVATPTTTKTSTNYNSTTNFLLAKNHHHHPSPPPSAPTITQFHHLNDKYEYNMSKMINNDDANDDKDYTNGTTPTIISKNDRILIPPSTPNSTTITTAPIMTAALYRQHSNLPLSAGLKSMLSKNFKTRPRREST